MMQKEGRRIKGGIPMDAVTPFIMPDRSGASNMFSASVNVEKCEKLLREKRLEGMKGLGMIHIFMAAYIRVVSELPGINRFIRGQRVYARNNMEICMVIKKELWWMILFIGTFSKPVFYWEVLLHIYFSRELSQL